MVYPFSACQVQQMLKVVEQGADGMRGGRGRGAFTPVKMNPRTFNWTGLHPYCPACAADAQAD